MKIDNKMAAYEIARHLQSNAAGVAEGKKASEQAGPEPAAGGSQDAVVHLSRASQDVRLAESIIADAPAVRDDKVAEIKARIEAGEYRIDHAKIASRMVDQELDELF